MPQVAEKFVSPTATATKIFVGFCGQSSDVKTQIAAAGGIATLAGVPEIAASFVEAKVSLTLTLTRTPAPVPEIASFVEAEVLAPPTGACACACTPHLDVRPLTCTAPARPARHAYVWQVLEPLTEVALIAEEPGLLHRAAVALQRLLSAATEEILGPKGSSPVPEQGTLMLGALSSLAGNCPVAPAKQAAKDAIEFLFRERPEVGLPPPQLVAEAVAKLRVEHEARLKEAEEEDAAEAAQEEEERKARKAAREEERQAKHTERRAKEKEEYDRAYPKSDSEDELEVV